MADFSKVVEVGLDLTGDVGLGVLGDVGLDAKGDVELGVGKGDNVDSLRLLSGFASKRGIQAQIQSKMFLVGKEPCSYQSSDGMSKSVDNI